MKTIIAILALFSVTLNGIQAATPSNAYTFHQKFETAQPGDYIVTLQDGNYSVLIVKALNKDSLILEDLLIPEDLAPQLSWNEWVEKGAEGHTAWNLFEIDWTNNQLIEAYSVDKEGWLFFDDSQHFLSKLLSLSLKKVSSDERRKIGPAPSFGDPDQRALWNPPLVFKGQKKHKPRFDVWKTKWPSDGTQLANCSVELYFDASNPEFPFPYWIEVSNGYYCFKMHIVDSGKNLSSMFKGKIPHRPPTFSGEPQIEKTSLRIFFKSPGYYKNFRLFAIDVNSEEHAAIPLSAQIKKTEGKELFFFELSKGQLKEIFTEGHRYRWVLVPENISNICIESEHTYLWSSAR